ncbi:hypothetical protein, partial [Burkholderia vietnamiensis]|uniref:hypothetical protein n=1 Tax=Burkholderia vietnamiensis TaxID=60552 RepID=UPI003FEDD344
SCAASIAQRCRRSDPSWTDLVAQRAKKRRDTEVSRRFFILRADRQRGSALRLQQPCRIEREVREHAVGA